MADALFEELKKIDLGIAQAYQQAIRGKQRIDRAGAEAIFKKAIHDKQISGKEAEVIVLMFTNPVFTADSLQHITTLLQGVDAAKAYIHGLKPLTQADLVEFNRALDTSARSMNFWSPGTKMQYRPIHYQAVRKLVQDGKIKVYEMKIGELAWYAKLGNAFYNYEANRFEFLPEFKRKPFAIVHEATHAVQDWRNRAMPTKYLEADAYIAEAVVQIQMGQTPDSSGFTSTAKVAVTPDRQGGDTAVSLLLAGLAVQGNARWEAQYERVAKEAINVAGTGNTNLIETSGPDESGDWHKVMEALGKAGTKGGKHAYNL